MTAEVTRFAPSPNGYLHMGHAYSALLAFEAARASGGRFLLRIEDIDLGRSRPQFEEAIYEDLAWLGLEWETPVRRQSEHFADYEAALCKLDGLSLTYPCFCTRKEIAAEIARSAHAPHGPDGALYPGTCRNLPAAERDARIAEGAPFAVRLNVAGACAQVGEDLSWDDEDEGTVRAQPETLGDVILARKDIPTSYHLAVSVDDALQGITLVVRGQDLFHATHVHRLLQALLGFPTPRYHHHELICDEDGVQLSKRTGAASLRDLRADGVTLEAIRATLGLA